MKNRTNCGIQIPEGITVCPSCGQPIEQTQEVAPAVETVQGDALTNAAPAEPVVAQAPAVEIAPAEEPVVEPTPVAESVQPEPVQPAVEQPAPIENPTVVVEPPKPSNDLPVNQNNNGKMTFIITIAVLLLIIVALVVFIIMKTV